MTPERFPKWPRTELRGDRDEFRVSARSDRKMSTPGSRRAGSERKYLHPCLSYSRTHSTKDHRSFRIADHGKQKRPVSDV